MVIAIDLDGVVFDTEEYFRTYAHIYDLNVVKNGLISSSEMIVKDRHGWDKKSADDFYSKYTAEILKNAPIKPGAKYVINQLKQQGHKLVCITLRGFYRQCEIEITEQRLKQANITFDKIIYSQADKLQACQAENVEVMLEDNPNTIKHLANNNIKCFYFRNVGLKKVLHQNVTEVQNWAQVYDKLTK